MTDTLTTDARLGTRDLPTAQDAGPPRTRLRWHGVAAALRSALAGLLTLSVLGLAMWFADDRSGTTLGQALRGVGQGWLVAHGATLSVPGGRVSLAPLGLCALVLLLLARAGARAGRDAGIASPREALHLALAAAVPYAAMTGAMAVGSRLSEVSAPVPQAVLAGFVLALVGTLAGALRVDQLARVAYHGLPVPLRRLLPALTAASVVLLSGGALLAGASLAGHGSRAVELATATDPGTTGGVGLLLVGLALVPNAAIWGAAWLAGPGFAVGVGTGVGPFSHAVGPLPSLPLLAAVPGSGAPAWAVAVALAVPLAAGLLAGRLLARDVAGSRHPLLQALALAPACAVLWATLAWLAGGAVGGARLTELGPDPLRVGLAVGAEVGALAWLTVAVLLRPSRRSPKPETG